MNVTEANKPPRPTQNTPAALFVGFDLNHLMKCGLGFDGESTKHIVYGR
jgi:hypothetical protein